MKLHFMRGHVNKVFMPQMLSAITSSIITSQVHFEGAIFQPTSLVARQKGLLITRSNPGFTFTLDAAGGFLIPRSPLPRGNMLLQSVSRRR